MAVVFVIDSWRWFLTGSDVSVWCPAMNLSRPLIAVSLAFVAAVTAQACSSSTSPANTGASPNCTTLAACCPSVGANQAACLSAVAAANDTVCQTDLATFRANNYCTASNSGSGSGTGTNPTDGGPNPGSSTGSGSHSGTSGSRTGTGSGTGIPASCSPHPLPTGWTPTTPTAAAAVCTAMQNVGAADCFVAQDDAGIGLCLTAVENPDGGLDPCGQCVFSQATASAWGAFVEIKAPTAIGATATTTLDLFNFGGCVALADKTAAGTACANALNQLNECEQASCLANCPVTSNTDTAGQNAIFGTTSSPGCLSDADNMVCLTYANTVNTACAAETNDAGTGAIDKCNTLITAANASTTPATAAGLENYMGLFCGGADAGF